MGDEKQFADPRERIFLLNCYGALSTDPDVERTTD